MKKYTKEIENGYKMEVIVEDNVIRMGAYDDEEGAYGILCNRSEEIVIWELASHISKVLEDSGYYETGGLKMTSEVLAPIVYLVNQHGKEVTGGGGYVESLLMTLDGQHMLLKDTEVRKDIIDSLVDKPWTRKYKRFLCDGIRWYMADVTYDTHDLFVIVAKKDGGVSKSVAKVIILSDDDDCNTYKNEYPNLLGEMVEALGIANVSFSRAAQTFTDTLDNISQKFTEEEKDEVEDQLVAPDVDPFERFLSSLDENMRKDPKIDSEESEEDLENIASSLKADVVNSIKELIDKNIEENDQLCGLLEKLDQPTNNPEDEKRVIKEAIDYFMNKITCLVDDEPTDDPDVVTEDVEEDNGVSEQTREEILQLLSGNRLSNRLRSEINPEIWKEAHIDSSTQTQSDLWFPDETEEESKEKRLLSDVTIRQLNFIADNLEGLEYDIKNVSKDDQYRLHFALGRLNGIIHKLTFNK